MKKLLGIKPREGGRSATLTYPVPVRRGRRIQTARLSVGAIRIDDDGKSEPFGDGFIRFTEGYTLAMFNELDLAAANQWLHEAAVRRADHAAPSRVSMADIGDKLDELLSLVRDASVGAAASAPGSLLAASPTLAPAAPAPVYVLPDGPVANEGAEARLLRLLRTFNAAAATIAPMMPLAASVFPKGYRFEPETVEEVERSWVLTDLMDRRLNGRGQLKRTGSREEKAHAQFGSVDAAADVTDPDEQSGT